MSQNNSVPDSIGRGGLATRDLEFITGKLRKRFPAWMAPAIIAGIFTVAAVVIGISLFNMQNGLNQTNDSISNINNKIQAISSQLTLVAMQPSPIQSPTPTNGVELDPGGTQGPTPIAVWGIKITPPENLLAGSTATFIIEISQDGKPAINSDISLTFFGVAAPIMELVTPQGPYKTDLDGKLAVSFPLIIEGDFELIVKAGNKEETGTFAVASSPDTDEDGVSDTQEQSGLYQTNPNISNSYVVTSNNPWVKFRLLYSPDDVVATIESGFSVFGFQNLQQVTNNVLAVREVEFTALYKPDAGYSKEQLLILKAGEQLYDPLKADQVIFKLNVEQSCINPGTTFEQSSKPFCEIIRSQGDFLVVKIRGMIGDPVLKPVSGNLAPSSTPTLPAVTETPTPGVKSTATPTPTPTSSNLAPTETHTKANN